MLCAGMRGRTIGLRGGRRRGDRHESLGKCSLSLGRTTETLSGGSHLRPDVASRRAWVGMWVGQQENEKITIKYQCLKRLSRVPPQAPFPTFHASSRPQDTSKYSFFICFMTRHRLDKNPDVPHTTNRFVVKVMGFRQGKPRHRSRSVSDCLTRQSPTTRAGQPPRSRQRPQPAGRQEAREDRQRIRATLRSCQAHGYVEQNVAREAIDGALPPMPAVKTHRKLLFLQHIGIGETTR